MRTFFHDISTGNYVCRAEGRCFKFKRKKQKNLPDKTIYGIDAILLCADTSTGYAKKYFFALWD